MKSPKLYKVLNINLKEIIENDYLVWDSNYESKRLKYQQDNPLFRITRNITGDNGIVNRSIIFVNCKSGSRDVESFEKIIREGFFYNGVHYVLGEMSASMQRVNQLSFIDKKIQFQVDKIITMDNHAMGNTVTEKMMAYRGLFVSSCFMMPDKWFPKIVIVDELINIVKDCKIKYLDTEEREYEDKETGEVKKYQNKIIKDGIRDIEVNCFDGFSIGSPNLFDEISESLDIDRDMSSFILRMPYMKGLCVKIDYTKFFTDNGIEYITDIWGEKHSVYEDFILADISLYKGYKYFKKNEDYSDWEYYMNKCLEYNHVFGVAKYSTPKKDEKVYTCANYQILQDLELDNKEFKTLSDYTIDYFEKIMYGEPYYAMNFLGIKPDGNYIDDFKLASIKKNPMMLREEGVFKKLTALLSGKIDDAKCGRIYTKSCFKFATPDIIAFMQHCGGIKVDGCLKSNQMWTYGNKVKYEVGKEYLITRNPHISKSEHLKIVFEENELIKKYIGDVHNIYMIDIFSIHMARLNGCDFDGDLLLCIMNEIMKKGVLDDLPITMDVDDKITVEPREYCVDSIVRAIMNNQNNRIGEISNMATCYINKYRKTEKSAKRYDDNVCLLSICNGKEIDSSKTGVKFRIPSHVQNYAKPLPYFMKYRSEYYSRLSDWNKYRSNMNSMCFYIEDWEQRNKNGFKSLEFDYEIMIDKDIPFDEDLYNDVANVCRLFSKEKSALKREKDIINRYGNFDKKEMKKRIMKFGECDDEHMANAIVDERLNSLYEKVNEFDYNLKKKDCKNWDVDWEFYNNKYKDILFELSENKNEIANYVVRYYYSEDTKKNKSAIWSLVGKQISENVKQTNYKHLEKCVDGDVEILGEKYKEVFDGFCE